MVTILPTTFSCLLSGKSSGTLLAYSPPNPCVFRVRDRYYASDPSNDQTVPWGTGPSLFGFVPPPTVEWKRHGKLLAWQARGIT